jgi:hypothetical protein
MESTDTMVEAVDESLLSRNDNYGSVILKMAADNPRTQQIAMAAALRAAKVGWTQGYRDRYFRWFPAAKRAAGGHSFSGFLDRIRDDALALVPERRARPLDEDRSRRRDRCARSSASRGTRSTVDDG